jgi:hypothetical protein
MQVNSSQAIAELIERIEHADHSGLDVFGIGEHHRKEFLDSDPHMLYATLWKHLCKFQSQNFLTSCYALCLYIKIQIQSNERMKLTRVYPSFL